MKSWRWQLVVEGSSCCKMESLGLEKLLPGNDSQKKRAINGILWSWMRSYLEPQNPQNHRVVGEFCWCFFEGSCLMVVFFDNTKVTHFFVVIIVEIFFDKKHRFLGSLFIKNSMVGFNHQHRQHLNCLAWFNHFGSNTWICCVFFCDFLSANGLAWWFGFLGWPVGKGLFPKGSP